MKIGITGSNGFIGWHLRCFLYGQFGVEVVPCPRETFASPERLESFVGEVDAVVHLAGVIRGEEPEIERINMGLARGLVQALESTGRTPHLIFASSIHFDRDTAYARAKRGTTALFRQWAEIHGGRFSNLILPHVFGERQKPYFNSVVATFCHRLAHGETLEVHNNPTLELIHAQDVCDIVWDILKRPVDELRVKGAAITVSELHDRLQGFATTYGNNIVPDLREPVALKLFNTYRSYLFPDHYPVGIKVHADSRGELFEAMKGYSGGQVFMSTTRPGITRGNHYHLKKVERFLVIKGQAVIRIRRMFDDRVLEFPVSGDLPQVIDIPTLHTHDITNTGTGDLMTLFWANQIFDPDHPDTVPAKV